MLNVRNCFRTLLLVATISLAWPINAIAFVNPPVLVPAAPEANETVFVEITSGLCDAFVEDPLDPDAYPEITVSGKLIRIVLFSVHYDNPSECVFPESSIDTYMLGNFPAANYTVQIDRIYPSIGGRTTETIAVIPLVVGGGGTAGAAQLPVNNPGAMLLMILVLMFAAFIAIRQRAMFLSMLLGTMLLANANDALAQGEPSFIELLVSTETGAPSADAIVDFFANGRKGEPPLESLSAGTPTDAYFLLPFRASGDFKDWIESEPDNPRARLERFVVVQYPPEADITTVLAALRSDEYVMSASEQLPLEYLSGQELNPDANSFPAFRLGSNQYGHQQLNIDEAWQYAGGYALIGMVDSGLYTEHVSLRQFNDTGQYVAGNFIPSASKDIALPDVDSDFNIDEAELFQHSSTSQCFNNGTPLSPINAGHGTHVAGLIAANSEIIGSVKGTCKRCGIAVAKNAWTYCDGPNTAYLGGYHGSEAAGVTHLVDNGTQVINLSLGALVTPSNLCAAAPPSYATLCTALDYAQAAGVVVVAASGNQREKISFPANDPRTVAVGGTDSTGAIWDDSPGSNTFCFFPSGQDCGSNWTAIAGWKKQEVVAAAKDVWSTTYPGKNWPSSGSFPCGDGYPGPTWGNGEGLCTGTSMSSPQVAGVIGILRSVNPLVEVSKPVPDFLQRRGIRTVLTTTTHEAQASIPWEPMKGYGIPDAAEAARRVLGIVHGAQVKNRVTPLFRFYSSTNKDYAETTSPQMALALMRGKLDNGTYPAPPHVTYLSQGTLVPGYSQFPFEHSAFPWNSKPRSNVYVLTTEFKPRTNFPDLIPIYLMDRSYSGGRDFMLVTTKAHIEQAKSHGYALRTIQGYIAATCERTTKGCEGLEPLYRACKSLDNDCATFLESERLTFEGMGYTDAWPVGSNKKIGYAYPSVDYDGDGLIDGFERVAGTKTNSSDSDSDNQSDDSEYSMIGLPYSDPFWP